jgi:RNA polymerase sigma-70 factor (ECF subfamily)
MKDRRLKALSTLTGTLYLPSFLYRMAVLFSSAVSGSGEQASSDKIDYSTFDREEMNERAEYLLNNYGNAVLRLAFSYVHNKEDAEEIVQDSVLQLLRARPVFENGKHELSYLMTITSNISKNRIKYNARHQTVELNEEIATKDTTEKDDDHSFILEACEKLPVKYKEVIHLFYCEDYSTAEISKILGMKETTVRSNLSRGRDKLKTILKEEYGYGI